MLASCAISTSSSESNKFNWDLSVENHSGISQNLYQIDSLHRGMSVFKWQNYNDEAINQLVKNNIEWIAIIPYYYQRTDTTKTVYSPVNNERSIRRDSNYVQVIKDIHSKNMHIFFKPHLWMSDGWRSDIKLNSDNEWDTWFDSYRKQILRHAILAEECKVELFCIGTEFRSSIENQSHRWINLIDEIREIYTGKLTYAANWDRELSIVPFWDKLDYIGIQAYFPLTQNNNPTIKQVKEGWKQHVEVLETLAKKHDRPILFTELGYRSDIESTIKPWEWADNSNDSTVITSYSTQNVAFEAFFQCLWDKEWFAGAYFWQWHIPSKEGDLYEEKNFSPRFKPAENTLAKWFGKTF